MSMIGNASIRVFAGSASKRFAQRMCDYLGIELGESETLTFSEGSTFVRILETVRDKDVYVVQTVGSKPNDDFVELLFWIDAAKRASANSVTVIMPFFSYSKGDKKDEPRVSIRARVCADCIETTGADRVVTIDLHSAQIQGFFRVPVDHLYATPVFAAHFKSLALENLVVVAPDIGATKRARKYAQMMNGAQVAICDKVRQGHDEDAMCLDIIGDVEGCNCLMVDDFTISCGTLVAAAKSLEQRGARRIMACTAHMMLTEQGVNRLMQSPIEYLFSSDTVDNPLAEACPKVRILSLAPLLAEATLRIETRQTVSQLFESVPESVLRGALMQRES